MSLPTARLSCLLLLSASMGAASAQTNVGTTSTNTTLGNLTFGANNGNPTGNDNTLIGVNAGTALTTGREMTILGFMACPAFDGSQVPNAGPENGLTTCIGSQAGLSMISGGAFPSVDNVFIGQKAALGMTAASEETLIGVHAGAGIATGGGDTIIGAHSMDGHVPLNSLHNTVIGNFSLNAPGDKDHLIVIGSEAAGNLGPASQAIVIGSTANNLTSASQAVIIGDNAGNFGTNVNLSVIIGSQAGLYTPSGATIVGPFAGANATVAGTFLGNGAGANVTTGVYNTCIGFASCGSLGSGNNNTSIGTAAGFALTGSEYRTVAIGDGATTTNGASNAIQIGYGFNGVSNSVQFNQTQVVDGNGDLHTGTSAPGSGDLCTPGAIRIVLPYIYACVGPNQWMRAALTAY